MAAQEVGIHRGSGFREGQKHSKPKSFYKKTKKKQKTKRCLFFLFRPPICLKNQLVQDTRSRRCFIWIRKSKGVDWPPDGSPTHFFFKSLLRKGSYFATLILYNRLTMQHEDHVQCFEKQRHSLQARNILWDPSNLINQNHWGDISFAIA